MSTEHLPEDCKKVVDRLAKQIENAVDAFNKASEDSGILLGRDGNDPSQIMLDIDDFAVNKEKGEGCLFGPSRFSLKFRLFLHSLTVKDKEDFLDGLLTWSTSFLNELIARLEDDAIEAEDIREDFLERIEEIKWRKGTKPDWTRPTRNTQN